MKNKSTLIILLLLCLFLCACGNSATAPEPTNPVVATEPSPTEPTMLTQEELVSLSKWMPISLLKQVIEDPPYAETLIGNLYRFDGIVYSVETDHAIVGFSLKDSSSVFEPEVETVAAEIYLSAEELASVVPMQKVIFIGRLDEVITNNEAVDRMVFYSAAIESDRFKYYGEIKELNTDYEPNTWNVQFTSKDSKAITFVSPVSTTSGKSYYYSYKEINGRYVDGYFLGLNDELITYDPVLLNWPDIIEMATPKLSLAEIQSIIDQGLTLDEVAERIDTLGDAIQYLHQKGYVFGNRDIHFRHGVCSWSVSRSARQVFEDNMGDCGGGSNLLNYLLSGDFEEQGYVIWRWNQMGHVTNYFVQDELYYFFDLAEISYCGYENNNRYKLFVTDDPQKFADSEVDSNHRTFKPDSSDYLLFLGMYAWEGSRFPIGHGYYNQKGWPTSHYQPKQYEDIIRILHAEGHGIPAFVEAPEKHLWPKEAQ